MALVARSTVFKMILLLSIFLGMMAWRRTQIAICHDKRVLQPGRNFYMKPNHNTTETNKQQNLWKLTTEISAKMDVKQKNNDALATVKQFPHHFPRNFDHDENTPEILADFANHPKSAIVKGETIGNTAHVPLLNSGKGLPVDNSHRELYSKIWASTETLLDFPNQIRNQLRQTLTVKANANRTVILSILDSGLQEFALNFYLYSLQRHHIDNYVFICLDAVSQTYLEQYGLACLIFPLSDFTNSSEVLQNKNKDTHNSEVPTGNDFGSIKYYLRTNVKTLLVLECLQAGYRVLISDVDVLFFNDPRPNLACNVCDLLISQDREYWNTGFALVYPTDTSKLLYTRSWKLFNHYRLSHDQAYMHMAQVSLQADNIDINPVELSNRWFPCGYYYFQEGFREFDNQPACPHCIIAHNNYLGSASAKRYRQRENGLWLVDNGYYSNTSARYLSYETPAYRGTETVSNEKHVLKMVLLLGALIGRIVILPKFHCCDCKTQKCFSDTHRCSLLHVLDIKAFEQTFENAYREHTFLHNHLVPESIKGRNATLNISLFQKDVELNIANKIEIPASDRSQNESLLVNRKKRNLPNLSYINTSNKSITGDYVKTSGIASFNQSQVSKKYSLETNIERNKQTAPNSSGNLRIKRDTTSENQDQKTFDVNTSTEWSNFLSWAEKQTHITVLHFTTLKINIIQFVTSQQLNDWTQRFEQAFICTGYEQWQVKSFL